MLHILVFGISHAVPLPQNRDADYTNWVILVSTIESSFRTLLSTDGGGGEKLSNDVSLVGPTTVGAMPLSFASTTLNKLK